MLLNNKKLVGVSIGVVLLIISGLFLYYDNDAAIRRYSNSEFLYDHFPLMINNLSVKKKLSGDYLWKNSTQKNSYSQTPWNRITSSKLIGFGQEGSITEESSRSCLTGEEKDSYLRFEGGMCSIGIWLKDSEGKTIRTFEQLKNRFAPIENETEAMSFAAVTQKDLKIYEINGAEVLKGQTLTIEDGFLVQLVKENRFGCGNHKPTGIIYKVSKTGDIEEIATENIPKQINDSEYCVD